MRGRRVRNTFKTGSMAAALWEAASVPPEIDHAHATTADTELVDAFAVASRALVGIVARSLAGVGQDVTLPQYRALVILSTRGPQRITDLATHLGVTGSTASRMIDRLVRKHLVQRRRAKDDRRSLRVALTESGEDVVNETTRRRRVEIERIMNEMPAGSRRPLTDAMVAFAVAAGEWAGSEATSQGD
jgi:DNA-binding MarR family transcriptional regulator